MVNDEWGGRKRSILQLASAQLSTLKDVSWSSFSVFSVLGVAYPDIYTACRAKLQRLKLRTERGARLQWRAWRINSFAE
eukprot:1513589-Amphidinium_carterae.1